MDPHYPPPTMRPPIRTTSTLLLLLAATSPRAQDGQTFDDPSLLDGLRARAIGPAGMSGRVAAVLGDPRDPDRIWVGAATGGLWRSTDSGLTFEPLFDDQPVQSIGALAIHPEYPDQIWVGTGEGNPRNSASVGLGVFRSMDGGRSWQPAGLDRSERIHRIVLHPHDPRRAWVAAMGPTWKAGGERGVYQTTDGGRSWSLVLGASRDEGGPTTGCADLAIDPSNPDHLLAALWDHHRDPWSFRSGGPGSGLHETFDGGKTWREVTSDDGLPEGELGRIGIAFAPSQPRTVYAVVEAEKNVICRSDDGGEHWTVVNRETDIAPRPFYYGRLTVDPQDPERVYNIQSNITFSIDGGKTFTQLVGWDDAHPDHHAMWIDPADPRHLWIGNDGGVYQSRDHGRSWRFCPNLPLGQPYHVRVDMDRPYHVYGGMQDNGSWRGPAYVFENAGIRNHHWAEVGFGDGFDTSPDPTDSMQGYAMSQEGFLVRWNLRTGERLSIRPTHPDPDVELRFNWNAGFDQDPHAPGTIWFGSQFVHRSTDRGRTWEVVSGDLTTNDPEHQKQHESGGLTRDVTGAENYTTITAIDVSPVERGVVWVGTDDGRLHVTFDGGESWTPVEYGLPARTDGAWVTQVVADLENPEAAFAIFDDHRRGDWTPYVFRTTDAGASWTRVVAGGEVDGVRGYALALAQDPVAPERLWFLGTEFGLWFTLDGGAHWHPFHHGIPAGVSCMDLVIHPREHDLVVATHGRAFYVVDDISPLRELAEVAATPLHLFTPPAAELTVVRQTDASRFPGATEFRGTNRPFGARLTFWVDGDDLPHPDHFEAGDESNPTIDVTVTGARGRRVAHWQQPVHRGLNRTAWDLRGWHWREVGDDIAGGSKTDRPNGPEVLPGSYTVTMKHGEHESTATLEVEGDARQRIAPSVRATKHKALMELMAANARLADAVDALVAERQWIDRALQVAKENTIRLQAPANAPDDEVLTMPDGSRYPALNDAKGARGWVDVVEGELGAVIGKFTDRGQEWYVHADGAVSTTLMIFRSDLGRFDPVTQVAQPTDEEPPFEERAEDLKKRLRELEESIRQPLDVEGITASDHAAARLGRARWLLESSYDAPTAAQRDTMQRALDQATQAIEAVHAFLDGDARTLRDKAAWMNDRSAATTPSRTTTRTRRSAASPTRPTASSLPRCSGSCPTCSRPSCSSPSSRWWRGSC